MASRRVVQGSVLMVNFFVPVVLLGHISLVHHTSTCVIATSAMACHGYAHFTSTEGPSPNSVKHMSFNFIPSGRTNCRVWIMFHRFDRMICYGLVLRAVAMQCNAMYICI